MATTSRSSGLFDVLRAGLVAVGPERRLLGVVGALALVLGVLETAVVYLVAQLGLSMQSSTEEIALGGGPLPTVVVSLGEGVLIAALTLIVTAGVSYPFARLSAEMSRRTLVRQRGELIREYLAADWDYRSGRREGYLQDLMGDYANRSERVVDVVSNILASTCGMLAIGAGALLIAPWAAIIVTLGVAAVGLVLRPLAVRLKAVSTGWLVENQKLMSRIAETSRMSAEVMAFDVGPSVERGALAEIDDSAVQTAELRKVGRLTPQLFLYGAFGLVLIVIGVVNASGSIDFSSVGPLLLLLVRALGYGKLLQSAVQGGIEYAPSIRALESEIVALRARRAPRGSIVVSKIGTVHLEDIGFEYTSGRSILREVNLKIAPGDAIAVVGPSGGGKTTLTQLIMRLREPTTGRIMMDGVDIGDIARSCWARLVAYVPQDNQLVRASVADNIRFYRSDVSDSEVERAARSAHLHDEIVALPRGYETPIGQGERDLSGGQRQRLGLARALVGQPGLLVLDEPTSALDQHSELLIRHVLLGLKGTATLLLVAHRPATMEICDRIIRVDDGYARDV